MFADLLNGLKSVSARLDHSEGFSRVVVSHPVSVDALPDLAVSLAAEIFRAVDDSTPSAPPTVVASLVSGAKPGASNLHGIATTEMLSHPGLYITSQCNQLCQWELECEPVRAIGSGELVKVHLDANETDFEKDISLRLVDVPLLGRGRQIAELEDCITKAEDRVPLNVMLLGPAGIGKTRFLMRFAETATSDRCRVVYSTANRILGFRPYKSVAALLSRIANTSDTDPENAVNTLWTMIGTPESETASNDALRSLFLLPTTSDWQKLDTNEQFQRQVEFLKELCTHLSSRRVQAWVFDDFHWFDVLSRKILTALARELTDTATVFIFSMREPVLELGNLQFDHTVSLGELNRFEATLMVRVMLGVHPEVRSISEQIADYAGGTPLFLEQLAWEMIENGKLKGTTGQYFPDSNAPGPDATPRIKRTIAERIEKLPASAKNLLSLASVIGEDIQGRHLEAILKVHSGALEKDIDTLVRTRFLSLGETGHVSFSHALIFECARDMVPVREQRELHSRCYRYFTDLEGISRSERLARQEFHARKAELWSEAFDAACTACEKAVLSSALDESVQMMRNAANAGSMLTGQSIAERRLDIRILAAGSLAALGQQEELRDILDTAETEARNISDDIRLNQVLAQKVVALWMVGKHAEALATADHASELAQNLREPGLSFATSFNRGMVLHATGRFAECLHLMTGLAQALRGRSAKRPFGWPLYPTVFVDCFRVSCLGSLGQMDEGLAIGQQAMSLADSVDHPYSQVMASQQHAANLMRTGNWSEANALAERGWAICTKFDIRSMIPGSGARLVSGLVHAGDMDRARSILNRIQREEVYKQGGRYVWAWVFFASVDYHLALQRPDRALAYAREALELTRSTGEAAHEVLAHIQCARALELMGDQQAEAESALRSARAVADQIGYVYARDFMRDPDNSASPVPP